MSSSTLICNINNEPCLVAITCSSKKEYVVRRRKKKPYEINDIFIDIVKLTNLQEILK